MSRSRQAREEIREAIKREVGSVQAAADAIGIHVTNLYAFLRGARLEPENAGALRAALPSLDARVWADAFAPVADDQAEVAP